MEILKEHGIKTYFSGCLTLLYKKSYLFKNSPPEASGVLVTDPFDRLKPSVVFSYNPVVLLRQILKYPIKLLFYKLAMKRLSNALSKSILPIQYISQIIDNQTLNNYDSKKLAEDYVRKIASAKVVITSRIHTALPATAMRFPVIFLNGGLNHINHKSRLSGLLNYFEICSSKDLKNIDIQRIKPKNNHLGLSERLKSTIDTFLEIS